MKTTRNILLLLIIVLFLSSCAHKKIKDIKSIDKEGIIIAGTYNPSSHGMLSFTSGIYVSIDDGDVHHIPWTESKYIFISSGQHKLNIWYKWFGKAGEATVCFNKEMGQTLYLEYHPSMWGKLSEPDISIINKKNSQKIVYESDCV